MKKYITIIILTVLVVCAAAACSAGTVSDEVLTTAVTNAQGQTKYYEYVTGENGELVTEKNSGAVAAEIETQSNGVPITQQSGEYVTKSETTVLPLPSNSAAVNFESSSNYGGGQNLESGGSGANTNNKESSAVRTTLGESAKEPANNSEADNEVAFDFGNTSTTASNNGTASTEKSTAAIAPTSNASAESEPTSTVSATDSEGWINKWY